MRLVLCFLLLTLALCCYEANAKVCNAVMRESTIFIAGSEAQLEAELQKYDAPPEAVQAKLQVKRCVDKNLNVIEIGGMIAILLLSKKWQAPRQESASESMILATIPKHVYGKPK
ncbi:secretoglobin family 1D member 4 [Peromyscus leucopus]|uniref:secretoglobin family 1D member 4 n=1 Tax=Peromyscus leucopus TaxID=10041 RepID=UPI001884B05E|nr:secretoglobin family 1D member 4 [Peromyscus leucopus]